MDRIVKIVIDCVHFAPQEIENKKNKEWVTNPVKNANNERTRSFELSVRNPVSVNSTNTKHRRKGRSHTLRVHRAEKVPRTEKLLQLQAGQISTISMRHIGK